MGRNEAEFCPRLPPEPAQGSPSGGAGWLPANTGSPGPGSLTPHRVNNRLHGDPASSWRAGRIPLRAPRAHPGLGAAHSPRGPSRPCQPRASLLSFGKEGRKVAPAPGERAVAWSLLSAHGLAHKPPHPLPRAVQRPSPLPPRSVTHRFALLGKRKRAGGWRELKQAN